MSDLIDRQLVLDRINKQREHLRPYLDPWDKIGDSAYRICAEFVERIPSTEPQRKKGKWICQADDDIWNCSECDFEIDGTGCIDPLEYLKAYKFCPNCGASMEEGDSDK